MILQVRGFALLALSVNNLRKFLCVCRCTLTVTHVHTHTSFKTRIGNFSVKTINSAGFVGHVVSAATHQLRHCNILRAELCPSPKISMLKP